MVKEILTKFTKAILQGTNKEIRKGKSAPMYVFAKNERKLHRVLYYLGMVPEKFFTVANAQRHNYCSAQKY